MHLGNNYISKFKNFLSPEECDFYIQKIESCPLEKRFTRQFGNYQGLSYNLFEDSFLTKKLYSYLDIYIEQNKVLDKKVFRWGLEKFCNIQKYDPGNCYSNEHCEHSPDYPHRVLAWMVYLNKLKSGGQTYWPQQRYKSSPSLGSLYVWPAFWTHTHYGIASKKEVKYIITGWCSYDYAYYRQLNP